MSALAELEWQLRGLLKGEFSHLSISFNDHACNYCSVREAIDTGLYEHTDWASDEEREAAAEKNSAWSIHWYPDTPIGFFDVSASTLEAALKAAVEGERT